MTTALDTLLFSPDFLTAFVTRTSELITDSIEIVSRVRKGDDSLGKRKTQRSVAGISCENAVPNECL